MSPLQRTTNAYPELVKMRPSKGVRFEPMVRVAWTLSLQNYTREEKRAVFYTNLEQESIRSNVKNELTSALAGKPPLDFELRGLEPFHPEASARRQIRRALALDVVLLEQKQQWDEHVYDAETIAHVYKTATQDSIADAQYHALSYLVSGVGDERNTLVRPASKVNRSPALKIRAERCRSAPVRQWPPSTSAAA